MIRKDLVDKRTGEKYHTLTPVNPKFKKEWLAMFQESLELISADKDLSGYTLRVFLALLARLDFENYICIPHTNIASITRIARPHVSKAISLLVEKEIIFKREGIGNINAYKLNPNIGWKGKVTNFEREAKKYPKVSQKSIPQLISDLDQSRNNKSKNKHNSKKEVRENT
jgi:hypothetical protein